MRVLMKSDRNYLFESPCIQAVIDFKWMTYAKRFFVHQFQYFLGFIALFTTNIYLQNYIYSNTDSSIILILLSYLLDTLACGLICYLNLHEVKSLIRSGPREYFTDTWNYVDIALFFTFALELIVNNLVVIPGFENVKKFL